MEHGIKITYSWGDAESPIECSSYEAAWKHAKELAIDEAETACEGWDTEVGIYFDPDGKRITLHYNYDDSYCYYNVF